MKAPRKKIVSRAESEIAHTSIRGRHISWWVTFVHKLTLECGHVKEFRGDRWRLPVKVTGCVECVSAM